QMHPIMRQYVAGKAGPEAMRQHNFNAAKLLLVFAQHFTQNFDALEAELPNLFGVIDWANEERRVEGGKWQEEAARIVTGMAGAIAGNLDVLGIHGHWNEARRRLTQAAEAARQIGNENDEAAF